MNSMDENEIVTENPLVSVGIPTYNRSEGLRRTLECITGQTYQNLEIIVSDNCSPGPDTEKIIREFMARDPRIHFFRQEENKGMNFNFKFVLEKASGEYFMWVADDDIWEKSAISQFVTCLNNNSIFSAVISGIKIIDDQGKIIGTTRFQILSKPDYNVLKIALFSVTHNVSSAFLNGLHRTDIIKKYTVNLDTSSGKDIIIVTEMLLSTKFGYIDELLYNRQVYSKRIGERYQNEEVGVVYGNPFYYFSMFFQLGPFLFQSKNIPLKRKLWVPLLVISQGIWVTGIYTYRTFRFFLRKILEH
jgi:glycosyltransferase involved in cell wall biosynthesis